MKDYSKNESKRPTKQFGPLGLSVTYACVAGFLCFVIYNIIENPGEWVAFVKEDFMKPIIGLLENLLWMLRKLFS